MSETCPSIPVQLCVTEVGMDLVATSQDQQYPGLTIVAKGSCCEYSVINIATSTGDRSMYCDVDGQYYALNNICTNVYNGGNDQNPLLSDEWYEKFDSEEVYGINASSGPGNILRTKPLPGETEIFVRVPGRACSINGIPPINNSCGQFVNASGELTCYHKDWTADPIQCCFQNMQCKMNPGGGEDDQPNIANSNCFAPSPPNPDGTYKYPLASCKPDFRRLGAADTFYDSNSTCNLQNPVCENCYTKVNDWCTIGSGNDIMTFNKLVDRWTGNVEINPGSSNPKIPGSGGLNVNQPCLEFFLRTLYNSGKLPPLSSAEGTSTQRQVPPSTSSVQECDPNIIQTALRDTTQSSFPNPAAYDLAKTTFVNAVNQYLLFGGRLDAPPGDPNSSQEFNETVFEVCNRYPSMCTNFLTEYCQNYTPTDLTRNPSTVTFCGCYLNQSIYNDIAGKFGINRECSAYCNLEGVIPLSDGTQEGTKRCNQSVCMINDVTLNLVQSRIDGAINIGNFCGSCSTVTSGANSNTSCSCVLENVTVDVVNSSINTINLNQACSSSICYAANGITQIDCTTGIPIDTGVPPGKTRANIVHNILILIIIVGFVFLLFILYFLIAPRWRPPSFSIPEFQEDQPSNPDRSYTSILNRF